MSDDVLTFETVEELQEAILTTDTKLSYNDDIVEKPFEFPDRGALVGRSNPHDLPADASDDLKTLVSMGVDFGPKVLAEPRDLLKPVLSHSELTPSDLNLKALEHVESIYKQTKEALGQLSFENASDFLASLNQCFRETIASLRSHFRDNGVPLYTNKLYQNVTQGLEQVQLTGTDSDFRKLFDHMRSVATYLYNELNPGARQRSGDVVFVPWKALEEQNLVRMTQDAKGTPRAEVVFDAIGHTGSAAWNLYGGSDVAYKGGIARTMLKASLIVEAKSEGLIPEKALRRNVLAELNLNDVDAIVPEVGEDTAERLSIDPKDLEADHHFWNEDGTINLAELKQYFNLRDIVPNEAILVPGVGIFATREAIEVTTRDEVVLKSIGRDLFGAYSYLKEGVEYLCPKALFRMINPVLGGYQVVDIDGRQELVRVSKFDQMKLMDHQVWPKDLGIYWLVLMRKSLGKPDAVDRLVQLHSLAKQMGSTDQDNPIDWWDDLIDQYDGFSFSQKEQTDAELLQWFAGKLNDFVFKEIKTEFKLHREIDDEPLLSSKTLKPDDAACAEIIIQHSPELEAFVQEMRERYKDT